MRNHQYLQHHDSAFMCLSGRLWRRILGVNQCLGRGQNNCAMYSQDILPPEIAYGAGFQSCVPAELLLMPKFCPSCAEPCERALKFSISSQDWVSWLCTSSHFLGFACLSCTCVFPCLGISQTKLMQTYAIFSILVNMIASSPTALGTS